MTEEGIREIREMFIRALERPASERPAFLDAACGSNAELRARVRKLLEAHEVAGDFLSGATVHKPASAMSPESDGLRSGSSQIAPGSKPDFEPGTSIGRYKLLEEIGEGGFGVVYMAEQESPVRRRVALKLIKLGMDTRAVIARFEAERQALAMMEHPNIAKVLDAGVTEAGRPYFVMELVRGVPLAEYCDSGKLTTRERLQLFIPICHAIQHSHHKGIIHRDLKPSNILVTLYDGTPVPKVIDFGVAKATNQRLTEKTYFTEFRQMIGTPVYMSPEQAEMSGLDIDTRSDIYSLGVLLYELLTGAPPFDSETLLASGYDEMQRVIREEEPRTPSARVSSLSDEQRAAVATLRKAEPYRLAAALRGDLDWIVMKAIEKDRTRRYATALEFAEDVERYLDDKPVRAGPPAASYRLRKYLRRNRGLLTTGAIVIAVLLLGLIVSIVLYLRAEDATRSEIKKGVELSRALAQKERALQTAQRANREKTEALGRAEVLYLTEKSLSLLPTDPASALLLALEAEQRHPGTFAQDPGQILRILDEMKERRTLVGRERVRIKASFSPDGRRVVTASNWRSDFTVRIWDASSGREHLELGSHRSRIAEVFFGPGGRHAFTFTRDGIVRIWDVSDGEKILEWRACKPASPIALGVGIESSGISVELSPDGRYLLSTASSDGTARLWVASCGVELLTLEAEEGHFQTARFDGRGERMILTAPQEGRVSIRDVPSGRELDSFQVEPDGCLSARFSPDEKRVLAASGRGLATIWDVESGKELRQFQCESLLLWAIFSPDGKYVVTSSYGLETVTVRIWDGESGEQLGVHERPGLPCHLSFTLDGGLLIPDQGGKVLQVVDPATGKVLALLKGHRAELRGADVHDRQILTFSSDGEARIWELESSPTRMDLGKQFWHVMSAAFSPDGRSVATASVSGIVHVYDARNGEEKFSLEKGLGSFARDLAFSRDGRRLLVCSLGGSPGIIDATSGEILVVFEGHGGPASTAVFSPYEQRVLTGSWDHTARIWDSCRGTQLVKLEGHGDRVLSAVFSPDGRRALTASADGTGRLWDARSGKELLRLEGHGDSVAFAIFSPDGERILTVDEKNGRLWDARTGDRIFTLEGMRFTQGGWNRFADFPENLILEYSFPTFSLDGRRILGVRYQRAAMWDSRTGKVLVDFGAEGDSHFDPRLSRDGRLVLTGGNRIQVWDSRSGAELCRLGYGRGEARFSPDGERVVVWSGRQNSYPWISLADPLSVARARSPRELSVEELERYEIGTPHERQLLREDRQIARLERLARHITANSRQHRRLASELQALGLLIASHPDLEDPVERWKPLARALEVVVLEDPHAAAHARQLISRENSRETRAELLASLVDRIVGHLDVPDLSTYGAIDREIEEKGVHETIVGERARWRYFPGRSEPAVGLAWTREDFDDRGWQEGRSGFGYKDDATLLEDMLGQYTTVYLRYRFRLDNLQSYRRVLLSVVTEDGFIAWVNGQDAGRARTGARGVLLGHDAICEDAGVEPIAAVNLEITSYLRHGENLLALQGVNRSRWNSDFSLLPVVVAEFAPETVAERERRELWKASITGLDAAARREYLDGRVLQRNGKLEDALRAFKRSLEASGGRPEPLLALAGCLRAAGKAMEAEEKLRASFKPRVLVPDEVFRSWLDVSRESLGASWPDLLAKWPPFARPHAVTTFISTAETHGHTWRYTTEAPRERWERPEFDDSSWKEGRAPFASGKEGHTVWKTPDIWLRTTFELSEADLAVFDPRVRFCVKIRIDGSAVAYLNGQQVGRREGTSRGRYILIPIPDASTFKVGRNTLAVHGRRKDEVAHIDLGLMKFIVTSD